jgi:hypothetical protein
MTVCTGMFIQCSNPANYDFTKIQNRVVQKSGLFSFIQRKVFLFDIMAHDK